MNVPDKPMCVISVVFRTLSKLKVQLRTAVFSWIYFFPIYTPSVTKFFYQDKTLFNRSQVIFCFPSPKASTYLKRALQTLSDKLKPILMACIHMHREITETHISANHLNTVVSVRSLLISVGKSRKTIVVFEQERVWI
nr:MAG TPA: hypothetical protein [Caudoviricetes sp.]